MSDTVAITDWTPTCHSCGGHESPFILSLAEGRRWRHSCGAIVCPVCGGAVTADGWVCVDCERFVAAEIRSQPSGRSFVRTGTIIPDRVRAR